MDKRKMIGLLRLEIENIRRRGFGFFRDTIFCLSACKSTMGERCHGCPLLEFVPPECRKQSLPCFHIPLDAAGCTVNSMTCHASRRECEQAILAWMKGTLKHLETELSTPGSITLRG